MITSETFFLLNSLKLLIDLARTCFSIVYSSKYHNYVDTINVNTLKFYLNIRQRLLNHYTFLRDWTQEVLWFGIFQVCSLLRSDFPYHFPESVLTGLEDFGSL